MDLYGFIWICMDLYGFMMASIMAVSQIKIQL